VRSSIIFQKVVIFFPFSVGSGTRTVSELHSFPVPVSLWLKVPIPAIPVPQHWVFEPLYKYGLQYQFYGKATQWAPIEGTSVAQ
jgi:hypothetical protein